MQNRKPAANKSTIDVYKGIGYNRPKICLNATWSSTGSTFLSSPTLGSPQIVFILRNNRTITTEFTSGSGTYVARTWESGSSQSARNFSRNAAFIYGIFPSDNDDIYIDNAVNGTGVERCSSNLTNCQPVMTSCFSCYALFIDSISNLYCSQTSGHRVIVKQLEDSSTTHRVAAGTTYPGSASYQLNNPYGIFVDTNLDLYVADSNNNRIQKFPYGEINGITVVGSEAVGTFTLSYPNSVILDANGYFFIVDQGTHRIIASGPTGFRCIIACSGSPGVSSTDFYYPKSISFDNYGNIYVADYTNSRIQKFTLTQNTCGNTIAFY